MRSTLHPVPVLVLVLLVGGSLAYLWRGPHSEARAAVRVEHSPARRPGTQQVPEAVDSVEADATTRGTGDSDTEHRP